MKKPTNVQKYYRPDNLLEIFKECEWRSRSLQNCQRAKICQQCLLQVYSFKRCHQIHFFIYLMTAEALRVCAAGVANQEENCWFGLASIGEHLWDGSERTLVFEGRAWLVHGVGEDPKEAGRRAICWGLPVVNDLSCRLWMFCPDEVTHRHCKECVHMGVCVLEAVICKMLTYKKY